MRRPGNDRQTSPALSARGAAVAAAILLCLSPGWAFPAEKPALLSGQAVDARGTPVEGAEIFLYLDQNVRRTADFLSPKTGKDGRFTIELPAGTYWAIARTRRDAGKYGPLMPGDKHSGDPIEVELSPGMHRELQFTLMNIREASRSISKRRKDFFKVQGRILDASGGPVGMAYAVASDPAGRNVSGIPGYLSAWTGPDGRYTLYLPAGRYVVRAALTFPPERQYGGRDVLLKADRSDVEITLQTTEDEVRGTKQGTDNAEVFPHED